VSARPTKYNPGILFGTLRDPTMPSDSAISIRRELGALTSLAAPMVATQLGMLTLGIVDIWMVGRLGPEAIASVALGDLWAFGTVIIAIGLVMGIDPLVTQAHGARDGKACALAAQRGIVLAVLTSIPLAGIWFAAGPVLRLVGQDPELVRGASDYCRVQVFSIAPYLVFYTLRQYLQGRARMSGPLWIILFANILNIPFNWVLIFGHLGFPALGIRGAGIATGLTRVFMMVAMIAWIRGFRLHEGAWIPWGRESFDPRGIARILAIGGPVGLHFAFEIWAFNIAQLFAGWIGTNELAAHTIVLKFAALSYMMPLGIAIGAATRVGNRIGAGDPEGAQRAAWVALAMGAGVMLLSAAAFVLLRWQIPVPFTDDARVLALCAATLPVAAAFQLFDGTQAVGVGILRGMGTTRPAAVFSALGFYGLALPLAWWLAFPLGRGLPGIWWGLCLGLGVFAFLLVAWIRVRGPAHIPRRMLH
jgi:MATE family multidrug resistance protein